MTALTITTREWNRISPDFKGDDGRQKIMLYYDRTRGTCAVLVQLDDENGVEYGPYSFQEHGLRHRVYAYSMAEALHIIRDSGHSLSIVRNLKRLRPYPREEQVKQIGGRLVYIYGGRYEIDGPDRQISGTCEPGSTLKQIYERHYPTDPRDGAPLSQCTLFYGRRGGRRIVPAHSACLTLEEFGPYLEGYALRFIRAGGTREHTLYKYFVSDSEGSRKKIAAFKAVGLDMEDFLTAQIEYAHIDDEGGSAQEKATKFYHWLDTQGLSEREYQAVAESMPFFQMFPAKPKAYRVDMMSEAARKKWPKAKQWGLSEKQYVKYYAIATQKKNKAEIMAEIQATGWTRDQAEYFWGIVKGK